MTRKQLNVLVVSILAAAASVVQITPSAAPEAPSSDPVQWHTEDLTPLARYNTAKKEAGAALHEALAECRHMSTTERLACVKEARERFTQDMASARQLLAR